MKFKAHKCIKTCFKDIHLFDFPGEGHLPEPPPLTNNCIPAPLILQIKHELLVNLSHYSTYIYTLYLYIVSLGY